MRTYIHQLEAMERLDQGERIFCEMKRFGVIYRTEMKREIFDEQHAEIIESSDSHRFFREEMTLTINTLEVDDV